MGQHVMKSILGNPQELLERGLRAPQSPPPFIKIVTSQATILVWTISA